MFTFRLTFPSQHVLYLRQKIPCLLFSPGYEDMYEQYHQYYQYNQYYKDYYQWMKQYQRAYPTESFYDDRTSIHSGRSSVNNEPEKSVSRWVVVRGVWTCV